MCAARRAFTLAELLVGTGLAAVIATVMLIFLYTSLQAQARMAVRADVQQQGIMAGNRLIKDLQSTVLGGVSLRKAVANDPGSPEVVAIHPLVGVATNDPPRQVFSSQIVVYAWTPGQGKIVRFLYPEDPSTPGNPAIEPGPFKALRVNQADLAWLAAHPPAEAARFGGDVTSLNVTTPAAPPLVGSPITVTITLFKQAKDRPYSYTMERTISLRNSD